MNIFFVNNEPNIDAYAFSRTLVSNRSLISLKASRIAALKILPRCTHNIQGWNMQLARVSVSSPVNSPRNNIFPSMIDVAMISLV